MDEKQRIAIAELCQGWLEKSSVGCLLVGLFQMDHMFGGFIGAMLFFLAAMAIKVRIAK